MLTLEKDNQKTGIEGIIRSFKMPEWVTPESTFDVSLKGFEGTWKVLDLIREYIRSKNMVLLNYLEREGLILAHTEQKNLITTEGREVMARLLAGDATYSGEITYGAVGSSTATPTNADTQLGSESYRGGVSSQAFDENIAYIDFFFAAGDGTGTHEEFGTFIDGTASSNSGQLWSHILTGGTGGWDKGASDSLFISCQYTFTTA